MNSFEPQPQNDGIDALLTEFFQAEMPEEKLRELERTLPRRRQRTVVAKPAAEVVADIPRRSTTVWQRARGSLGLIVAAAVCVVAFVVVQNSDTPVASNSAASPETDSQQSRALLARLDEHPAPTFNTTPRVAETLPAGSQAVVMAGVTGSKLANLFSPPEVVPSNERRPRNLYDYRVSEESEPVVRNSNGAAKFEQRARVRTTNVTFFEPRTGAQVEMQLPEIEIEIVAARESTK